jgi:hypothetical protein
MLTVALATAMMAVAPAQAKPAFSGMRLSITAARADTFCFSAVGCVRSTPTCDGQSPCPLLGCVGAVAMETTDSRFDGIDCRVEIYVTVSGLIREGKAPLGKRRLIGFASVAGGSCWDQCAGLLTATGDADIVQSLKYTVTTRRDGTFTARVGPFRFAASGISASCRSLTVKRTISYGAASSTKTHDVRPCA